MTSSFASDPWPGRELEGRWRVLELIGSGAMGRVYRAEHVELGRVVAVKVLNDATTADEAFRRRFRREAMVVGRLAHPNIVGALDVGTSHGALYLVMELLSGRGLDEVLLSTGPLAAARVERVLRQVAQGLASAHRAGVVHRDVKPANVVLVEEGPDEHTKLVDFGIAAEPAGANLTIAGLVLGTPNYAAPEQILGHRVTPAADVYALGCTVYELLAGHPPFHSDELSTTLQGHLTRAPTPLQLLRPEVPGGLAALIHAMLEKDATRRPRDGQAVLEALGGQPGERVEGAASLLGVRVEHPRQVAAVAAAFSTAGLTLGRLVGRSLLAQTPSAEVAFAAGERLAQTLSAAVVLHHGVVKADDEALEGGAAADTLAILRVVEPGQLVVTASAHDALGLGFRARLVALQRTLVDFGELGQLAMFELDAPRAEVSATVVRGVREGAGVSWACPCGQPGRVSALPTEHARVRCLACSNLLEVSVSLDATTLSPARGSIVTTPALADIDDVEASAEASIIEGLSSLTGVIT